MPDAQRLRQPSAATVTANVARALFDFAAARGHDAAALARGFELEPDSLRDLDARIPVETAQRLWAELPRLLDDDDLGIHLAQHLAPQGALLPVLLLASASTLGEGIDRGMEFQRALAEGSSWRRAGDRPGRAVWVYEFADPVAAAPRHALEFGIALMVLVTRRVVRDDLAPAELRFRHPPPRAPREHEALFRCALSYGQARDEIHMFAESLALPVRTANPSLLEHLEAHGRTQLRTLAPSDGLPDRVQRALRDALSSPAPLTAVARALRCSPRTLQRRLRDEGTTFQALLDRARYARACELLRAPDACVKRVAAEVGFSEQASFHRAFVRWSGETPGRWREAAKG
ncbi:MAG: AraC family transcriptional regulator ligand-binding domain-containing protein [Polyangiales bacterium]